MSSPAVKKEVGEKVVKKESSSDPPPVATASGSSSKASPRAKIVDFGLAEKWEDSRVIRDLLRDNGRLIRWLGEKQINIINLETLGLNSNLMCMVADYHCARSADVKPPRINFLKAQAGESNGI